MMNDLHDYTDVAENYDLYIPGIMQSVHGLAENFLSFHLELAEKHGRKGILDLGCGTGALAIPLAERQFQIYAVDISAAMLDILKSKLSGPKLAAQIELIHAPMTDFSGSPSVGLVLIARSGFLHLLSTEEQMAALCCINRHLDTGGILCFNTFDPSYTFIAGNSDPKNIQEFLRTEYVNTRGNKERIYNCIYFNCEKQWIQGHWVFEETDPRTGRLNRRERPVTLRWTFKPEIELLARLCGFTIREVYGGYDKSQPVTGGNLVWLLQKMKNVHHID